MPKRIVDGDALWRSDKIAQIKPDIFRAEYANMIPLAMDDGTFECNPRRVWADVYSYNRPDISVEVVEKILKEFERVGLLKRWADAGKEWGFWIGIESRLLVANAVASQSQTRSQASRSQSQTVANTATSPLESTTSQSQNPSPMYVRKEGNLGRLSNVDATDLFGQAKKIYRRYVGKSIGSLGPRENQWRDLVLQHGEMVLSAVEIWAQEGGKGLRNLNWPLAMFLKNADEFVEAAKQIVADQQQETTQDYAIVRSIEAGHTEFLENEKKLLQERAEEERAAQGMSELFVERLDPNGH